MTNKKGTAASKDSSSNSSNDDQTQYFGVVQSKQLPTNHMAVFDLDTVVIIFVKRESYIHGIRPLNKLTVGDAHLTLCKQKQTSALCVTNGDRNKSNPLLDLLFTANKVRTFQNYQLCLFQLNIAQDMWCVLKYMSNPVN